jgi:hypothetical protein
MKSMNFNRLILKQLVIFVCVLMAHNVAQSQSIYVECPTNPVDLEQDKSICIPVRMSGVTFIDGMELTMLYNKTNFAIDSISTGTNNMFRITPNDFSIDNTVGIIRLVSFASWTGSGDNILFYICGKLIGQPGNKVFLTIDPINSSIVPVVKLNFPPCSIEIKPKNGALFLNYGFCPAATNTSTDGRINIKAVGGQGPYTYSVTDPSGTTTTGLPMNGGVDTLRNLIRGTYTFVIRDAIGTILNQNIVITPSPRVNWDISKFSLTNPSCAMPLDNGRLFQNGSVTVGVKDGAQNYDFVWSTSVSEFTAATSTVTDLTNGIYKVSATDNFGCTIDTTLTLNTPVFGATLEQKSILACVGSRNLDVKLAASGGAPFTMGSPYKYRISVNRDIPTDGVVPVTDASRIQILDRNGCSIVFDIPRMIVNGTILYDTLSLNINPAISLPCGKNDTLLTLILRDRSSTNASFTQSRFRMDSLVNLDNRALFFDVRAGNARSFTGTFPVGRYRLYMNEFLGGSAAGACPKVIDFTITTPKPISYSANATQTDCATPNGSIRINRTGGNAPFTYQWSHDATKRDSILTSAIPGTYRVMAFDTFKCLTFDTTIIIKSASRLTIDSIRSTQPFVCGRSGKVAVFTTYGTPNIVWSNGATTKEINVTTSGLYKVTIKDSLGICTLEAEILVPAAADIMIGLSPVINVNCAYGNNTNTGAINVANISGGSRPFTYEWRKDASSQIISADTFLTNIGVGNYTFVVKDANGCSSSISRQVISIVPRVNLIIDQNNIVGVKCIGTNTGQATAMASGGSTTPNYVYSWSNSFTRTNQATDLRPGTNWVVASENGCQSDTVFFNISQPTVLRVDSIKTNPSCAAISDGSLRLTISGDPNETYRVIWTDNNGNNLSQSDTLLNVGLGTYQYIVRINSDPNCPVFGTMSLTQAGRFRIGLDSLLTSNSSCTGANGGQIGLKLLEGSGTVQYSINGQSMVGNIATKLNTGTYSVIGIGEKGCRDTLNNIQIAINPSVTARIKPIIPIKCTNGKTCIGVEGASGGTGRGFTFSVNSGLTLPLDSCVSVFAGRYFVDVFDSEGCRYRDSVTITQPNQFKIDLGDEKLTIQLGGISPEIKATPNAGFTIASVAWNPSNLIQCVSNGCDIIKVTGASNFTLKAQAIDINGCIAFDEIAINLEDKENVFISNVIIADPANSSINFENATWKIETGVGVEKINSAMVLDRWGNKVYTFVNNSGDKTLPTWDGKYNGSQLNPGVYVYSVEVQFVQRTDEANPRVKRFTGSLTIAR